jgi:hypothetical protein
MSIPRSTGLGPAPAAAVGVLAAPQGVPASLSVQPHPDDDIWDDEEEDDESDEEDDDDPDDEGEEPEWYVSAGEWLDLPSGASYTGVEPRSCPHGASPGSR